MFKKRSSICNRAHSCEHESKLPIGLFFRSGRSHRLATSHDFYGSATASEQNAALCRAHLAARGTRWRNLCGVFKVAGAAARHHNPQRHRLSISSHAPTTPNPGERPQHPSARFGWCMVHLCSRERARKYFFQMQQNIASLPELQDNSPRCGPIYADCRLPSTIKNLRIELGNLGCRKTAFEFWLQTKPKYTRT